MDGSTGPQLLNCQMQSHFTWLLFPWNKKFLVRQFGAGGDFHPFGPLLHCHNNFVAIITQRLGSSLFPSRWGLGTRLVGSGDQGKKGGCVDTVAVVPSNDGQCWCTSEELLLASLTVLFLLHAGKHSECKLQHCYRAAGV